MESPFFDEAKPLISPIMNKHPLFLLHLLLVSDAHTYMCRFLLEQLLLRVLFQPISPPDLPFLQVAVHNHRQLVVELIESFMRSHEDVSSVFLLNINELELQDALLTSEYCTVFNHIFVKNFNKEKQASLEPILLSRIDHYGVIVLTTMVSFIIEQVHSLESACNPVLSLLQYIDHLQRTIPSLSSGQYVDIGSTIQVLCNASTPMKNAWEETVKHQADTLFQDLFKVPRSSDSFCASIRKLRHSPYYYDTQVYHEFLNRLLSELTMAVEGGIVSGDTSFMLTLASFITSLFIQRVLEEEEHDTLESFVNILKKFETTPSGLLLLQKVLPSIRTVVQDHRDIDVMLKSEYARLAIQQPAGIQDVAPGIPITPLRSVLSATPSFSEKVFASPPLKRSQSETIFPEFNNCMPLDDSLISNIKRVMNQLGSNNLDRITQRLFSLVQPSQFPSFARFFVDGYVLRQPQYLDRYVEMIISQHNDFLEECILDATILQAQELVKIPDTSITFLKSAGSFIGSFTLQRDRVLPLRKLNLNRFLDECLHDGSLKNCLPFVTQIMRSCVGSKVLSSYHQPWVHSVLVKLIALNEDTTISTSVKSKHIVNMLDVFGISGEVLEELKKEATALQAPVSASPSVGYLKSVPSYPSSSVPPSSVPPSSVPSSMVPPLQPSQSAPGMGPPSVPSTPGMSLQPNLSLQSNGYIRTPSLQPLSPLQPTLEVKTNDNLLAMFQDCFFRVIGSSLSLQQRVAVQSLILSHFHQMQQTELPSLIRAVLANLPDRREQRSAMISGAVEELLTPQYELLRRSFAGVYPQVDIPLCLVAYGTAVKQIVLRQVELIAFKGGDSVLSTINELNTQSALWSNQRHDSVSFTDVLWQLVSRTAGNIAYYLKAGQNALSPAVKSACQHFVLELSPILMSQPLKADPMDPRYAFLLDYLSRVLTDSSDPSLIPRQTLAPYILSTYDQILGVAPMVVLEAALKRCLIKPESRLNVLFLGRLVKDQLLPVKTLDDVLTAVLSTTPSELLDGSNVVVTVTSIIQQLMLTRHRLFTNQLPSTIRKAVEVTTVVSESTPHLLELKMVLLRLQRRYEVLVQEAAYLAKFSSVLRAWLDLCSLNNNAPGEEPTIAFIVALKRKGLLQSETQTVVALRLLLLSALDMDSDNSVPLSVASEVQNSVDSFSPIHGFTALAIALYKYTDPGSKSSLLLCILTSIGSVLTEEQKNGTVRAMTPALLILTQLQQTILEPLLPQLLHKGELGPDPEIIAQTTDLLRVFLYGLQLMQPSLLPSFSYGWAASFSYSPLIRLVHSISDPVATNQYRDLLLGYVRFLSGFMNLETVSDCLELHFKTLTTLLLELHSLWPDLLSMNYGDLCLLIPPRYLQLRNIICSAVPAGITMFSPREAMSDRMTKCLNEPTKDTWDTSSILAGLNLSEQFAAYRASGNPSFMNDLARNLPSLPKADMVFALLYEVAAATYLRSYPDDKPNSRKNFPVDFYTQLLKQLQPQLRPSIVMSLLDHVRYPSFDTYTFCMLMKTLMGHDYNDAVFACICDRMLVPGPKPWGLEFLFSQLVNSDPDGIRKLNCYNNNSRVIELFGQYYSSKWCVCSDTLCVFL